MKTEFTAIYEKHGKWIIAYVEELPGANTQGRTLKEAKENLKEAVEMILEAKRELALDKKKILKESFRISA